jgi:hypothetical protein
MLPAIVQSDASMKVTIADGNNRITRDLPQIPEVGDDVRIIVADTPDRDLAVQSRRWVFRPGEDAEVEVTVAERRQQL